MSKFKLLSKAFVRVLRFFSLADREGNLSATNATLFAIVVKMLFVPGSVFMDSSIFIVAILNYMQKRYEVNKAEVNVAKESNNKVLEDQVASLISQVTLLQDTNADIIKQAEDVKKIVSHANLSQAFGKR